MAAYAALNSVMYILQQIQHHPRPPITIQKQHMDSLCEIISFLQDFLEKYSHRDIADGREALESHIANAAYAAEDIIESHIVDQILAKSKENNCIDLFYRGVLKVIARITNLCSPNQERSSNSLFCQDLQKVMEDMNLIKKDAIKIQEKVKGIDDDQLPRKLIIGSSTVPPPKRQNTNTMVGFDDVLYKIMDRLIGCSTHREVLPIVGMGGIGKTTLATHAYNNPLIENHFDIRIWITISQEYMLRDVLLQAFSMKHENKDTTDNELGLQLHKRLCGRRYLIVLDDMWSIEPWEELMLFFPENYSGSRIMITTRLSDVSNHFESCVPMPFLDEDKSWNLFCKVVFPQDQRCPPELEEIGMKIARNCKGLPLSIAVIGGLLAKSEKTQRHWEYIAENLNRIINLEDDKHCLNILYLSYNHLPIHLKPCFLYLGNFREDKKIDVPWLKKLWVAEGFLKPIAEESLKVVAEKYLNDLIDRNLILVHQLGCSGKVKYCKIHDLLRDLCLTEAKKDKFLWVPDFDNLKGIQTQRRISFDHAGVSKKYHIKRVLKAMPSASLARSLICAFGRTRPLSHNFRLVRVCSMKFVVECMIENIFESVNSRFLEFDGYAVPTTIPPSSIHLLWNLQTLIIRSGSYTDEVPPEIWEMSHLRHLEIRVWFSLPDPPNVPLIHEGDDGGFIFRNLHTLRTVQNLKLSEEAIKRIPNIKKLCLRYVLDDHNYCLNNLGRLLNKLESLECSFDFEVGCLQVELVKNLTFPHSLKKLSLQCIYLHLDDMRMIGSLPHLRVLKLQFIHSRGGEWNPVEGEFQCLKFLQIDICDVEYWNANSTHFPCLEQLVLKQLQKLREIPLDMGQISTLESIELWDCSDSAIMSAKNILDEQVGLGNENLQVRVTLFDENTQPWSFRSHNFQVQDYRVRKFRPIDLEEDLLE